MKTKNKITVSILLAIFTLLINAINIFAFPLPHGIDGIVYNLNGTEELANIHFSVNDTVTGEFTTGITGYGSPGRYSIALNGNDGNIIIIKAWNQYHSTSRAIELGGVMHNVNLFLNTTALNTAPTITSTPITVASPNYDYTYQVETYDNENDPLTYSLITYPQGMTINETSGLILWTPNIEQIGNHTVIVTVSDGELNGTQEFIITVSIINHAPIITSEPITTAIPYRLYTYDVDAYDPDGDILHYTLLQKPRRMRIRRLSGVIRWLPRRRDIGNHTVIVQVSDGELNDTQEFIINVDYQIYGISESSNLYSPNKDNHDLIKKLTPIISKIKVPYRISGTIYNSIGKQTEAGTLVIIENINTSEITQTKTGIGPSSGAYYTLLYGKEDDLLKITINNDQKKVFHTTLKDNRQADFIVNKGIFIPVTGSFFSITKSKLSYFALVFIVVLIVSIFIIKKLSKKKGR